MRGVYRLALVVCAMLDSFRLAHTVEDLLREIRSHAGSVLQFSSIHVTVSHKNRATLFSAITPVFLNYLKNKYIPLDIPQRSYQMCRLALTVK